MVVWRALSSGMGKVGTWVAVLAAVALFALPPSLGVAAELSGAVEPIAVVVLAIFLVAVPAFIVWASLREAPLNRIVWRRVALTLCTAGAGATGFISLVEGLVEGRICGGGQPCFITDLPWTIPSAIALAAAVGLLPLGLALLVGIPRISPGENRPNQPMILRMLALLPVFVLAAFLVNGIIYSALTASGGQAAEPRTMTLVAFLVPTTLFTSAWPIGIALLPGSSGRLAPVDRNHLALAVVALAVPLAYFAFWNFLTFALDCYHCSAFQAAIAVWGRTAGASGSPLLAAVLFLPLAFVFASMALARQHSRRTSAVESILGEVRALYANGRLKRGDYLRMVSMSEGMLEDGEASSSEFRAMLLVWAAPLLLVGPLLATIVFATIGPGASEEIGPGTVVLSWTANVASLLACVAAGGWMLLAGLNKLAVAREINQDQLGKIRTLHESLIHMASEAPLLPHPTAVPFKRTPRTT